MNNTNFINLIPSSSSSSSMVSSLNKSTLKNRFIEAAKSGDIGGAKMFLEEGCDPNTRTDEGGGLHAACILGSPELLQLFIDYGADLSVSDHAGYTPLHYAASFGSIDCCEILLNHRADLEAKTIDKTFYLSSIPIYSGGGRTPLMVAVLKKEIETVQYLLSRGAQTKIQDNDGRTAYDLACRDSKLTLAAVLEPERETHIYINEPINIPHKIFRRSVLQDQKNFLEYKKKIFEQYKPIHPEVYTFSQNFFEESFIEAVSKGTEEALVNILTELSPGVYSFKIFKHEFCDKLLEELNHFESMSGQLKIDVRRPNSMNNYGVILDDIGFYESIQNFMFTYITPFSQILFKNHFGDTLDDHHCFLVRYKTGEDLDLALHVDDAEVTFNVCLGKQFKGGTLSFYGVKGDDTSCTHPSSSRQYIVEHSKGIGILHAGLHWHEANKIELGERFNLILWCRSSKAKKRNN